MSELSVNDHLEGILSDFEALKRSFDIEDVNDIPSFSSASPVSPPISPSSSHLILNHNKANEGRGGSGQSHSLPFNSNNSLSSSAYHSHISLSSNPSPVLKSRAVIGSLSFNRGTMNKPAINNNGTSVTRASSFQNRFNPNGYTSPMRSGPGSDNDSLHSSSSSLEYSGGVGGAWPLTKLGTYPSSPPPVEYHRAQPQLQHLQGGVSIGSKHSLKKFSSHGSVFHSELDQGPGMMLGGVPEPGEVSHGSMPSLDLQIRDGGGGGIVGMQRGGGRMSPGLRYVGANANWNGSPHTASSFGEEDYCVSSNHCQQQQPHVFQAAQPKAKEMHRLNKFPLDLDNLVSKNLISSPTKANGEVLSPNPPKPPPRSTGGLQHPTSPQSTSASLSASLSSLESSSDILLSFQQPFSPYSPHSSSPSKGCILVPEVSSSPVPLSPAQTPQLELLSGPQVVQVVTNPLSPYSSSSFFNPRAATPLNDDPGDAKESVGSILQRIASFSRPVVTDTTPTALTHPPIAQSNGVSSAIGCHIEAAPVSTSRLGKNKQEETAGGLETDTPTTMEGREEERGILGEENGGESKSDGEPVCSNGQNSMKEKEGNCVDIKTEEEVEKGMEEGELKKEVEVEAEVNMEAYQSVAGLPMSIIQASDLFGYVGIEAVLDQMRRKTMKAGFEFNIMVVGQSGLGKSTLVNTLFKSKVSRKSCTPNYEEKISKTVKLHSVSHLIEERGVKMKLTVIDTPGFGDQINNENCWEPIVKYVNEQYEKYLTEELHINRKRRIPDTRVHCCVYFLPPSGHRLRPIDVEFMKRLGNIVSIVPVIAKADTLTIEERLEFKERIRYDLAANGIRVYPQKEYDEDPEESILNDRIRENIPFAVVGTDKEHQVNGKKVLGRKTKWGIIEVENVAHCEFANLRDLLIRSHLEDLKDVTHNIHYETYRVRRLNESNMNFNGVGLPTWLLEKGTTDKSESDSHL